MSTISQIQIKSFAQKTKISTTKAMNPTIEKFAAECLIYTEDCWDYITGTNLYALFNQWCRKNHFRNCSRICFTVNMRQVKGPEYYRIREPKKGAKFNAVWVFRYTKQREPL